MCSKGFSEIAYFANTISCSFVQKLLEKLAAEILSRIDTFTQGDKIDDKAEANEAAILDKVMVAFGECFSAVEG